jgi:hypothetical protein
MVVETKGEAPVSTVGFEAPVEATAEFAIDESDPRWRPNPMPLPTYVTAPKAVRPIRVIDLTTPGAWTSGRLLDDEVPPAEDTLAQQVAEADALDVLLDTQVDGPDEDRSASSVERRRAVGD